MKTIYKVLVGACILALCSCSKSLLEIEQQGVLTTKEYVTADDTEVEQFIAAVYAIYHGDGFDAVIGGGPYCQNSFRTIMSRLGGDDADFFRFTDGADGADYAGTWRYFYRTIYWCNMIIENLPANEVASASVKNQVIAEARTVRAICMSYLVQLYGNPPLADHILDGTEPGTKASESWAFIESELSDAAESLPSKSGLGGQAAIGGRLTREAAYAHLGRAQLWQKKYSEAASTLYGKVIATGKYALNAEWSDYCAASTSDFSDENIWEFDFDSSPANASAQEGCFDLTAFSPNVTAWYDTWASLTMTWGMGCNTTADLVDFMKAHDGETSPRFVMSIMDAPKASVHGNVATPQGNNEGWFKMKDVCLAEDCVGTFPYLYSTKNMVYMRYAEVLLNYAEAVAEGGTPGSLSGLEALNMVRRRAGLTDAPSLSMDDATFGVKAERRAELYGEGFRFIDVVRWGDGPTVLKNVGKQMATMTLLNPVKDDAGHDVYTSFSVTYNETGGPGFVEGKNELLPIPANELNQNPTLKEWQNPGW